MIETVILHMTPAWRALAEERVAGLTLLGRALLALSEAGAHTIILWEGDPELTERALEGRAIKAALCHETSESAFWGDVAAVALAESESLALYLDRPFALDRATAKLLLSAERPARLGDAVGLRVVPLALLRRYLGEAPEDLPGEYEVLTPPFPDLARPLESTSDLGLAEDALLATTQKPIAHDGAVAFYLMRPISRRLTQLLWDTPVTPSQVTLLALFLGVLAGPVVAAGSFGAHLLGAVLLFAGAIVDCVDGELARLKYQGSRAGEWLDTLADDLSTFSYLLGLGAGVSWLPFGIEPFSFGLVCALVFAVSSGYIYSVLAREVGVIDTARFPYFFYKDQDPFQENASSGQSLGTLLSYAFKRDFFTALFIVLALFGVPWLSLLLLGLGSLGNAAMVLLTAILRRR